MAAFASRGEVVKEMGKLVASLTATGTAILNADDEQVLAMAAHCAAKVITFGGTRSDNQFAEIFTVFTFMECKLGRMSVFAQFTRIFTHSTLNRSK